MAKLLEWQKMVDERIEFLQFKSDVLSLFAFDLTQILALVLNFYYLRIAFVFCIPILNYCFSTKF